MGKKYHVTTTINGDDTEFLCEAQQTLLDVLRDELMLSGTKEGCATGDCGACTVMVDDTMVCSCLVLAVEAEGTRIDTIEGMAKGDTLHPLQHSDCRQGAARAQPGPDRDRNPLLACRQPVPVHRL
jgi:carbon-monoxide dehydrogenase small subunit